MSRTIVVTGGAGFIGSALIRHLIVQTDYEVVNVDKLTYAGNLSSLEPVTDHERYHFEKVDIGDGPAIADIFRRYKPSGVIHLAAESHVDRSIDGPAPFIKTNVVGTTVLLEAAREYLNTDSAPHVEDFRFHHVSTDEVYGSLGSTGKFTEQSPYRPNSPYSASKASSDHFVRAWHATYGLPVVVSNCSNNYGPYQFPEKLIPVVILNALEGRPIPVYGTGENVRDWLYVEDHVRALITVFEEGMVGETYNIGGNMERKNIELVEQLCLLLDDMVQEPVVEDHSSLITFVSDRPGHDLRYAIDNTKIRSELDWEPREDLASGLEKTVAWYLDNLSWCEAILGKKKKLERLGLGE